MVDRDDAVRRFPPELDMSTPTVARAYDYLLGGKDNFGPDRELGEALEQLSPGTKRLAHENRGFLKRAVDHVVTHHGVRQFLDLGAGLPTAENTHEIAQRAVPEARAVYVDIDPIVLAHGRAILADNPNTTVITADVREVDRVLNDADTQRLLDFSEPVCVMLVSLLHCFPDSDDPFRLVRDYLAHMPSGSAVVYSHLCSDDSEAASRFTARVHDSGVPWGRVRAPEECAAALAGLEIVPPDLAGTGRPQLVDCHTWRNEGVTPRLRPQDPAKTIWEHAGVGLKS
ncbi:SAM-dependent methyltransferase [Salinactinospora qingdaonensis]|uniref:SAM-dependent methyltransferase n=1 Tax=Salinactinospora qingdaonensis TaxID=702744 RepID=A0ABP7G3C8_9ACTN